MLSFNHPLRISKQGKPCVKRSLSGSQTWQRTKWLWILASLCYYSQIEGLGLHVVNITHYIIRIKKHLHNRIEIELNYKEYESLHP